MNSGGCEKSLLLTESPKNPGHYRYLIWVLVYIPYTGLAGFSLRFLVFCVHCDFEFLKFVFSTLLSKVADNSPFPVYLVGWKVHCYG